MCKIVYISISKYIIFCGQTFVLYHILWTNICVLLYSVDKYLRFIIFCGQIFVLYHILWTNICVVSYSVVKYLCCIIFCGQIFVFYHILWTNIWVVSYSVDKVAQKTLKKRPIADWWVSAGTQQCPGIENR